MFPIFASNKTEDDLSGHRPEASLANSTLISRNVTVAGRRTSVRLQPAMWQGFFDIAGRERLSIHQIATAMERRKPLETSHRRAGHGRGAVELLPALESVTGA